MGIAERLTLSLHSSQEQTIQALDSVFDTLHKHSQIDYLILGKIDDLQFLLYPYGVEALGSAQLISLGKYVGRLLDRNFSVGQVSSDPGKNTNVSFRFPTFRVDEEQYASSLSGIIYPTQEYAEQVHEAGVLHFESKRWAPIKIRQELREEIITKERAFPKLEISHIRLQEVLAGK